MGERTIDIQYYAIYRDAKKMDGETVNTRSANARELYAELGFEAIFPFDAKRLKVAINDEFAAWEQPLGQGDLVVFIAPVAGG
jgi:molybdopterin converting factor small subunit